MRDPFDACIFATRKLLYAENAHLKQLIAENTGIGYIQFKKGKIYGLELTIDNLIREKKKFYDRKPKTNI